MKKEYTSVNTYTNGHTYVSSDFSINFTKFNVINTNTFDYAKHNVNSKSFSFYIWPEWYPSQSLSTWFNVEKNVIKFKTGFEGEFGEKIFSSKQELQAIIINTLVNIGLLTVNSYTLLEKDTEIYKKYRGAIVGNKTGIL